MPPWCTHGAIAFQSRHQSHGKAPRQTTIHPRPQASEWAKSCLFAENMHHYCTIDQPVAEQGIVRMAEIDKGIVENPHINIGQDQAQGEKQQLADGVFRALRPKPPYRVCSRVEDILPFPVEMTAGGQPGDSAKARCPQPDHSLWKTPWPQPGPVERALSTSFDPALRRRLYSRRRPAPRRTAVNRFPHLIQPLLMSSFSSSY